MGNKQKPKKIRLKEHKQTIFFTLVSLFALVGTIYIGLLIKDKFDSVDPETGVEKGTEEVIKVTKAELKENSSPYDVTYQDTLMRKLLGEHYVIETSEYEEELAALTAYYKQTELQPEEGELEYEAIRTVLLNYALLDLAGITDDMIQEELAGGNNIRGVVHAIVFDHPEDVPLAEYAEQVKKDLQAIPLAADAEGANSLLDKHTDYVDFSYGQYGKYNIIKGFESILKGKLGEIQQFGDDTYISFMRVMEIAETPPTSGGLKTLYANEQAVNYSLLKTFIEHWLQHNNLKIESDYTELFLNRAPEVTVAKAKEAEVSSETEPETVEE